MCLTPRPANAPELRDPITGHSRRGEPPGAGAAKVPAEHEVQTGAQGCPSGRTQTPEARALYGGISWEVTTDLKEGLGFKMCSFSDSGRRERIIDSGSWWLREVRSQAAAYLQAFPV